MRPRRIRGGSAWSGCCAAAVWTTSAGLLVKSAFDLFKVRRELKVPKEAGPVGRGGAMLGVAPARIGAGGEQRIDHLAGAELGGVVERRGVARSAVWVSAEAHEKFDRGNIAEGRCRMERRFAESARRIDPVAIRRAHVDAGGVQLGQSVDVVDRREETGIALAGFAYQELSHGASRARVRCGTRCSRLVLVERADRRAALDQKAGDADGGGEMQGRRVVG